MTVDLAPLAELWPEAVRLEIKHLDLADAKVALPVAIVADAMKTGRVVFSWKAIRSWISPSPLLTVSALDGIELVMSLEVIMPAFLGRQKKAAKPKQQLAVDDDIPDLFCAAAPVLAGVGDSRNGQKTMAGTNEAPTKSWALNQQLRNGQAEATVGGAASQNGTPANADLDDGPATPGEIVTRATALAGVAGALVALPDGLMVAGKLLPGLDGEKLAAFLPQMFGKVSEGVKELSIGEMNNLDFTVDNVPWRISQVNSIFFATIGCAGQPLPTTQLAALGAKLDHKRQ